MAIVDEIDHPAIQTMFDFHNTPNETEAIRLCEAIIAWLYESARQDGEGAGSERPVAVEMEAGVAA